MLGFSLLQFEGLQLEGLQLKGAFGGIPVAWLVPSVRVGSRTLAEP